MKHKPKIGNYRYKTHCECGNPIEPGCFGLEGLKICKRCWDIERKMYGCDRVVMHMLRGNNQKQRHQRYAYGTVCTQELTVM